MKNIKYYAGLLDSDGSIQLTPYKVKDGYIIRFLICFSQKTDNDYILEDLAKEYEIDICRTERYDVRINKTNRESKLNLSCNKAIRFLEQVNKHLVIKRILSDFALKMDKRQVNEHELKQLRKVFKSLRDNKELSVKNFPSRQWLAGYIDGDGYIGSSYRQKDGNLEFKCIITSHINDPQGIYLINKIFKGYIIVNDNTIRLNIPLNKTNAESFITYFNSHLRLKKNQFDFVLDVLRKGKHFKKNGATERSNMEIHKTLQELKKPQRLSEHSPKVKL